MGFFVGKKYDLVWEKKRWAWLNKWKSFKLELEQKEKKNSTPWKFMDAFHQVRFPVLSHVKNIYVFTMSKTTCTNRSEEDGQNHRFTRQWLAFVDDNVIQRSTIHSHPAIIHPAFSEYLSMWMQQRCLDWRRYSIMMFLLCRHYSLHSQWVVKPEILYILFQWTWQQECYEAYFFLLIWQTLQSDWCCSVPSRLDWAPRHANPWPWHC